MPNTSAANGKAFEYACLEALHQAILKRGGNSSIKENKAYITAKKFYESKDKNTQEEYQKDANLGIDIILPREPTTYKYGHKSILYLQSDDRAKNDTDVRDLVVESQGDSTTHTWGISIKHNHDAARHSRLSPRINFGEKWYRLPVSERYWNEVSPVFSILKSQKGIKWEESNIDKENDIYIPLLKAFRNEIIRAYETQGKIILVRILKYIIGEPEFYKFISKKGKTCVERYDLREGSIIHELFPNKILKFDQKAGTKTTLVMEMDNSWTISFRIHNASSKIQTSMKFDVTLLNKPDGLKVD
jgi:type II restriction enzyme haeIII (endonuclease haeIII)